MLQYIGARYVPIFYQNSVDPTSSEWENNVTYEPMTWVSLPNGHMYISKKLVPTSVGSPVSNPEYWLEAGQYNAYIQTLQDEIDDMKDGTVTGSLQNQIDEMNDGSVNGSLQNQINNMNDGSVSGSLQDQINDMKDGTIPGSLQDQINDNAGDIASINTVIRKLRQHSTSNVIAIGDSWGSGANGLSGWSSYLPNYFTGENLYQSCQGGYAWSRSGLQFISLLQGVTVADPNKIDLVIVAGGINDAVDSPTINDIETAMSNLTDYVATTYPNAIVIGVGINCHYGYDETDMRVRIAGMRTQGYRGRFFYIDFTRIIPPSWYASDGIHLNSNTAYARIGKLLSGVIQGVYDDNATLDDTWATTRYSTSVREDDNAYFNISQRKVNGRREIKIQCHSTADWNYFTFNQNLPAAGVKTYLNFTELMAGIDITIPQPIPLMFVFRTQSTGVNFNGIASGAFDVRNVGQANNALHIDFTANQVAPYTIQRISFPAQTFVVDW